MTLHDGLNSAEVRDNLARDESTCCVQTDAEKRFPLESGRISLVLRNSLKRAATRSEGLPKEAPKGCHAIQEARALSCV